MFYRLALMLPTFALAQIGLFLIAIFQKSEVMYVFLGLLPVTGLSALAFILYSGVLPVPVDRDR